MTRTEIKKRINEIEEELFYESMKDREYDFAKANKLYAEKRELEEMLKKN